MTRRFHIWSQKLNRIAFNSLFGHKTVENGILPLFVGILSSLKYMGRKHVHLRWLLFWKFRLCYGQPNYLYYKYYLIYVCVFSPWLEIWDGPSQAYQLPFYQNNFKIVLRLAPFKIRLPKSDMNTYMGRRLLVPPPTEKMCVCGESHWRHWWFEWCQHKIWKLLKHFKLSTTFLLTHFLLV